MAGLKLPCSLRTAMLVCVILAAAFMNAGCLTALPQSRLSGYLHSRKGISSTGTESLARKVLASTEGTIVAAIAGGKSAQAEEQDADTSQEEEEEENEKVDCSLNLTSLVTQVRLHRTRNNVWMSRQEQALIESYLDPHMVMLEYGSGFSTMWYSKFVDKYYSVEHNGNWGKKVTAMVSDNPRVTYRVVSEKPYTPAFRQYVEKPREFNVKRFDAVLVDGRQRVDCSRFVLDYVDETSVVFVHDYYKRPHYFDVEKYYDVIGGVMEGQSLVVLRKKKAQPHPLS